MKNQQIKHSFLTFLFIAGLLSQLNACRSSEFRDIFLNCAPECFTYESPVPVEKIKEAFEQVIATLGVSNTDLTGRWIMLSANRHTVDTADEKAVVDLLFSKSMIVNEAEGSVTVSDCHQEEIYPVTESGFTIPRDSVFFSSLYFTNDEDIEVRITDNIRLDAGWQLTTIQGTKVDLEVSMYKVSDNSESNANIGSLGFPDQNSLQINCYSHLHLYNVGQKKFGDQWISFEGEVKELLLKLDDFDDISVAIGFNTLEGSEEYSILFNQDYSCFGFSAYQSTQDLLSFEGSFTIDTADVDCSSKSLGEYPFNFSAL